MSIRVIGKQMREGVCIILKECTGETEKYCVWVSPVRGSAFN